MSFLKLRAFKGSLPPLLRYCHGFNQTTPNSWDNIYFAIKETWSCLTVKVGKRSGKLLCHFTQWYLRKGLWVVFYDRKIQVLVVVKFHICMCILYVYYTYIHMYYILIPKKLSLVTMIPRNIKPILMFALIIIMDHLLLAELASLPTVGGWSWSGTVGSSVAVAAQWVKFKWRRRARSHPRSSFLPSQHFLQGCLTPRWWNTIQGHKIETPN